eukprot:20031-Heterococcus_DN1.PRE.2
MSRMVSNQTLQRLAAGMSVDSDDEVYAGGDLGGNHSDDEENYYSNSSTTAHNTSRNSGRHHHHHSSHSHSHNRKDSGIRQPDSTHRRYSDTVNKKEEWRRSVMLSTYGSALLLLALELLAPLVWRTINVLLTT